MQGRDEHGRILGEGVELFESAAPQSEERHRLLTRDRFLQVADELATRLLLSRLLTDQHELVTLIEGEGSKVGDTRRISEWLSEEHPDVALEVHHGGQPLYPYLLGIE